MGPARTGFLLIFTIKNVEFRLGKLIQKCLRKGGKKLMEKALRGVPEWHSETVPQSEAFGHSNLTPEIDENGYCFRTLFETVFSVLQGFGSWDPKLAPFRAGYGLAFQRDLGRVLDGSRDLSRDDFGVAWESFWQGFWSLRALLASCLGAPDAHFRSLGRLSWAFFGV